MPIGDNRSSGKSASADEYQELLSCRMAMLGLDLTAIERGYREVFDSIKRRCTDCGYREACAVDMKRDPNNPVWESYCPNSDAFNALSEACWVTY